MKYLFSIILISAFSIDSGFAQSSDFNVGGRYAMGVSNITSDALEDPSGRLSFNAGFAGMYPLSNLVKLQVDILGSWKGANDSGEEYIGDDVFDEPVYRSYDAMYKFIDLEVPLVASIHLLDGDFKIGLGAGVATNFNLVAINSRAYDNQNYNEDNGFDNVKLEDIDPAHFSHVLSIGFHVGSGDEQKFFFEVRRIGGLSDLGKLNESSARHNRMELGIGYYL